MSKIIYTDIRGLNYPFLTGVNSASLHILYQIRALLKGQTEWSLVAGLLTPQRWSILCTQFPWLGEIQQNSNFQAALLRDEKYRLHQLLELVRFYTRYSGDNMGFAKKIGKPIDLVYQLQPKPITLPKNSKLVLTLHDISILKNLNKPNLKHALQENKLVYQYLVQRADLILASSFATAYDLARLLKVPENKIKVVYLALPEWGDLQLGLSTTDKFDGLSPLSGESTQACSKPFFLALSAFEYRKNLHNLLLAWKMISRERLSIYENYELVLAGGVVDKAYYHYILNLIAKWELKNIRVLEDISTTTKERLLNGTEFLIYTSLYEGFGLPILEANHFSKAVLTSNVSSMPEIGGKTALLVNPLSPGEICDGIIILTQDLRYRKELELQSSVNLARFNWFEYRRAVAKVLADF